MKTIKQALRQPIKTFFGILMMTLAAAVFCICVGQAVSARATIDEMEASFTTIGLQEGYIDLGTVLHSVTTLPPADFTDWVNTVVLEHPEIVKHQERCGVLSAYIPDMTPLHFTEGLPYSNTFTDQEDLDIVEIGPEGMPYTCAALTFRLEDMSEVQISSSTYYLNQRLNRWVDFPDDPEGYEAYLETLEKVTLVHGYTVILSGVVTDVVSLQEGFRNPVGMTLRITLEVATMEELEAMDLELGGEYLAFGVDYTDEDWILRSRLASDRNTPVEFESFDPEKLKILEGEELELWKENGDPNRIPYAIYDRWFPLSRAEYDKVNSVSMTMGNVKNPHNFERDEDGAILSITKKDYWTATNLNRETTDIPLDEYLERYRLPMIARIHTTVEDFLSGEEGEQWKAALEWSAINYHAFVVVGTDQMSYVADFAKGNSKIVEGRDFTEEEKADGARVCLIHEKLAIANGLKIGDTITLNMYEFDQAFPYYQPLIYNTNIPAYYYYPTEAFVDNAEYTIVGFWRGQQLWIYDSESASGFLPNTVFVPKSSVQSEMTYIPSLSFNALVLHNGQTEAFRQLAVEAGYEQAIVVYDHGYAEVSRNFHNYDEMGRKVLIVGVSVCAVLTLLFLMLFPVSRRSAVRTMESLGVSYVRRVGSVVFYSAAIVIPSALLGGMLGSAAWRGVISKLTESAQSNIALNLSVPLLAQIALVLCAAVLVLSALVGLLVAGKSAMSKKR